MSQSVVYYQFPLYVLDIDSKITFTDFALDIPHAKHNWSYYHQLYLFTTSAFSNSVIKRLA